MYNCNDLLNKFYDEKVRLPEDEKTKLRGFRDRNVERVKEGIKKLEEKDDKTYAKIVRDISQGSMAMHTINQAQNNDDQDIDHALIFEKDELPESAEETRTFVANALKEAYSNFKKAPEVRTNAVTVWYQDNYHVDLAIYRRFDSEFWGLEVLEHAGAKWAKRNPTEINDWFKEKKEELSPDVDSFYPKVTVKKDQLRRIVRLLKYWSKSRSSWSLPGGLVLTVLTIECYRKHNTRDDLALYETLKAIQNRLVYNKDVLNPLHSDQSLLTKDEHHKQIKSLEKRLKTWISKLDDLEDCTEESNAKKIWKKFFKNNWWEAEENEASASFSDRSLAVGTLDVNITVSNKSKSKKYVYHPDGTGTIPKGMYIEFLARTNFSGNYYVEWEVQNEGDEAEWEGEVDPRKGFVDSSNFHYCHEHSGYRGDHLMICRLKSEDKIIIEKKLEIRIR